MPINRAEKLCPDAVFLPVDIGRYRCISAEIFAIYERFTVQIEKVSTDEAYLALPSGKGFETARKIRKTVKQELGLSNVLPENLQWIFRKRSKDI